mgnify:CR=1 FL=1
MKNPTPGKNPFELESYRDKMPLHIRELYDDMTRNYTKLQGRAGLGRFWRFWAFAVCYLALLMVISDTTTDTILVFVGLVLCGWLYIAVPSFTISVRRLHDDGKPVFWSRFSIYLPNSHLVCHRTGSFGRFLAPWPQCLLVL